MKTSSPLHAWLPLALTLSAACGDTNREPDTTGDTAPPIDSERVPDASPPGFEPGMDVSAAGAPTLGGATGEPNAGVQDDASAGPTFSGPGKPKCMQKDSQLMVIGDSYINWPTHSFPQDIARESGQNWRMLAIGGFSMATGALGKVSSRPAKRRCRDLLADTVRGTTHVSL